MSTVTIHRNSVREVIYGLQGCIMRVNFISRQTGEAKSGLYTTNLKKSEKGGTLKFDPIAKRLIIVTDVVSAKRSKKHGGTPYRSLPEEGVVSFTARGVTYLIQD